MVKSQAFAIVEPMTRKTIRGFCGAQDHYADDRAKDFIETTLVEQCLDLGVMD